MDLTRKRTFYGIIVTLGMLIGLNPFSIDMYLPGFGAIAASLNTDVATVGLSLASFFAGICIGQVMYGPVLDRFGRKKPLLFGLGLYIVTSILCAFVTTVEQLIVLRFIQALGGCAGMVASRAMVRDIFPAEENAKIFSMLILVMGVAPIIAPSVGGLVVTSFEWHAIFIVLAVIAVLITVAVVFILPESKGPDTSISLSPLKVIAEYWDVVHNRSYLLYTLAVSLATAALFGYITSSPVLYMEIHGLTEFQYSFVFSFCAFCLISGSQVNRLLLKRYRPEQLARWTGALLVLTGLALVFITLEFPTNIVPTIVCIASFMFLMGIFNPNTGALSLTSVSEKIGMASAMMGFIQMGLSAAVAVAVSSMAKGSAIPMSFVILGCMIAALSCVLLVKYELKITEEAISLAPNQA